MTVYVAGKEEDRTEISSFIREIERTRIVTYNWTVNRPTTDAELANVADDAIEGIKSANIIIFLFTDTTYSYSRSCVELGLALAMGGKMIWMVGPRTTSIANQAFWHHHSIVHMNTKQDALYRLNH